MSEVDLRRYDRQRVSSKNLDWRAVKDQEHSFFVEERPLLFTAREVTCRGSRKSLSAPAVVFWSSEDAKQAQAWLKSRARHLMSSVVRCMVCEKIHFSCLAYAYFSGSYCSSKCYDTLFLPCLECGQRSMDAKRNADPSNARWQPDPNYKEPYSYTRYPRFEPTDYTKPDPWYGPTEQLCSGCHMKKHKYSIVCITSGRMG